MGSASVLQALHITLCSGSLSPRTRAAAARTCSGLRATALTEFAPRSGPHRRLAASHATAKTIQAVGAHAVSLGGSGTGGGSGSATGREWQRVAVALDRQQPDAVLREFLQLAEQGSLPSAAQCDRVISTLCKMRRFRDAWRAYGAVKRAGTSLQYNSYQALISAALKAGDLEKALDAFRDLQSLGFTPNMVTYCGLISALGKERRRGVRYAQLAHELWRELAASGLQLDGAAYRTGMKACVDAGRLRDADRLLQSMAAAGCPPDVRAYNILMAGHSRAANPVAMGRLLQRMQSAGVTPSAVTWNTLADGYVRGRDLAAAKRCTAQATAAGVALDVWTYSTLIKGYVQAGQLAAAESVLGDMAAAGVKPTIIAFTTLIDGHVRGGDMASARRVLQAMRAAGETPNVVTYNTLLRGYVSASASSSKSRGSGSGSSSGSGGGSSVATLEAAGGPGEGGALDSGAADAAEADGRGAAAGPLTAAQQLLQEMQAEGVGPTTDTFNTLMAAAVAGGDCPLALQMHQRLRSAGLRPDGLTYTVLIQAYGRMGRVADAMSTFEALLKDRSASADLRAHNAVVDALARNGDMPAAERLLERATELAAKQGAPPPVEAFGAVVAGYARQLSVGPAFAAVKRFHAAGGSPDAQMLDILANIAIRAGDYRVAMQAVRALELIGREVDKAKYAALAEEMRARQAAAAAQAAAQAAASEAPADSSASARRARSYAAYQRRREARRRNVAVERFKFWLGLPNRYYSESSDTELDGGSGSFDERDQ